MKLTIQLRDEIHNLLEVAKSCSIDEEANSHALDGVWNGLIHLRIKLSFKLSCYH